MTGFPSSDALDADLSNAAAARGTPRSPRPLGRVAGREQGADELARTPEENEAVYRAALLARELARAARRRRR